MAQTHVLRRLRPVAVALVAALAASASVILILGALQNNNDQDVILDEPGVFQEPGIGTNAPIEGTPLGNVIVSDIDGQEINTASLRDAGRPILINFWFSNCQPCKREMPALQAAFEKYADRVTFVGINTQDSAKVTQAFAQDLGVTYQLWRDPNGKMLVANGVSIFPTTLFVSTDGTIIKQVSGELTAEAITTALLEMGIS
ncbi:MAG: TlpA disulfide reductase family protein [Actinomycetes bacterium]